MQRIVIALSLILLAVHAKPTYENPYDASRREPTNYRPTRLSYENPLAHNDDRVCNQRCYKMQFNATVITASSTSTSYCNTASSLCPVAIYIRTNPCTPCEGGYDYIDKSVGNSASRNTTVTLRSRCMFAAFKAFYGPNEVAEVDVFGTTVCNPNNTAGFYLMAYNNEYTVVSVRSCNSCQGTWIAWILDYFNGRHQWPTDAMWARHFVPTYEPKVGTPLYSEFIANGNRDTSCNQNPWLTSSLLVRPTPVSCTDATYKNYFY